MHYPQFIIFCYVAKAVLKFLALLPHLPRARIKRNVPPCPTNSSSHLVSPFCLPVSLCPSLPFGVGFMDVPPYSHRELYAQSVSARLNTRPSL